MSNVQIPAKLEIHYYLKDDTHAMDAFVFNNCERELLTLIKELSSVLSLLDYSIDVEAISEGGIRNRLLVYIKNPALVVIVTSIISSVITTKIVEDAELNTLEKEKLKLEIQKLKKDLDSPTSNDTLIIKMADLLNTDAKIAMRKSNFYENVLNDKRVSKIGTTVLDRSDIPLAPELVVERKDFQDFILDTSDLDPTIVEDATIEILSPVFKNKKRKWVGNFEGKSISFAMNDLNFTKQILEEKVVFKTGTKIDCVLEINRKLDQIGELKISGYNVALVFRCFDHSQEFETPQGIEYKNDNEMRDQPDDDDDELAER